MSAFRSGSQLALARLGPGGEPHTLSYRIAGRGRRATAHDAAPEDVTPVLVRLGPAELATVDALIIAGIVNSRSEGLRWALSRLRDTRPTTD